MLLTLYIEACASLDYKHAKVLSLQLVKAVSGAVVGLRDQLEALTILDETALTWPGLSLVSDPNRKPDLLVTERTVCNNIVFCWYLV